MGESGVGELYMVLWCIGVMALPFTPWALLFLALLALAVLL